MATNSLEIFKQLFLKHPKDIKEIFTNVTAFVKDKDRAIADFLSVEYPKLIWLIGLLHVEYEKHTSNNLHPQQQLVENIARNIILNVDETGTLNYGQQEHNNLVLNTLETHLIASHHAILQNTTEQEDIISLDGSQTEMDILYQKDTTFNDIATQLTHPTPSSTPVNSNNNTHNCPSNTSTPPANHTRNNASQQNGDNNNHLDVTVTQKLDQVMTPNANDVVDVAHLIDQVVMSRGQPKSLRDSIHALKGASVVNLPPNDLCHRLNKLRDKPTSEQPGFLLIKATSIPGFNRLDKLNLIRDLSQPLTGFLDLNWMYHDRQAAVIVEYDNQQSSLHAQLTINDTHLDIDITNVTDLRTILSHQHSNISHTPRYQELSRYANQHMDVSVQHVSSDESPQYTYRLRYVPLSLKHDDIKHNLSYYGKIVQLTEIDHLPPSQREILITFDSQARLSLLDHIWAVNVRGYNISIAKAHLTTTQLDYRKAHVASFKGFNYRTTESQALRLFRPYGGMSCHFHQNIAYLAFKSNEQMHAACQLRLYTDDDRLLSGRPRVLKSSDYSDSLTASSSSNRPTNAMSKQTHASPDISSNLRFSTRKPPTKNMARSPRHAEPIDLESSSSSQPIPSNPDKRSVLPLTELPNQHYTSQAPKGKNSLPTHSFQPICEDQPVAASSQLDLILAKLAELDAIKNHLSTIDHRLNSIQSPPNSSGTVAYRS